jgi:hypothetical protein
MESAVRHAWSAGILDGSCRYEAPNSLGSHYFPKLGNLNFASG